MKTKKLFIITLIFSFLFIFTTSCFASVDYLGKQLPDFPEEFYNYEHKLIYYYEPDSRYCLFLYNGDNVFYDSSKDQLSIPNPYSRYHLTSDNPNNWSFITTQDAILYISNFSTVSLIYSDQNINYKDTSNVFFYQSPLLPTTTTLSVIGGTVWQTVAPLIIMIFLVVVFLAGFSKAYRVFLRLLRRA